MRSSSPDHRSKVLDHLVKSMDALEVLDTLEATLCDAIIVVNASDGTVLRWNPHAEHLLGYRASEVIGRPVFVLEPKGHPGEILTNLTLARRGVVSGPLDTARRRKDGSPVTVTAHTVPVRNSDGEVAWVVELLHAA